MIANLNAFWCQWCRKGPEQFLKTLKTLLISSNEIAHMRRDVSLEDLGHTKFMRCQNIVGFDGWCLIGIYIFVSLEFISFVCGFCLQETHSLESDIVDGSCQGLITISSWIIVG